MDWLLTTHICRVSSFGVHCKSPIVSILGWTTTISRPWDLWQMRKTPRLNNVIRHGENHVGKMVKPNRGLHSTVKCGCILAWPGSYLTNVWEWLTGWFPSLVMVSQGGWQLNAKPAPGARLMPMQRSHAIFPLRNSEDTGTSKINYFTPESAGKVVRSCRKLLISHYLHDNVKTTKI